jgi:putative hemolysin
MGAFEFADRRLREVLIPHSDVVALPADLPVSEAALRLVDRGHQRAPVYRDDLDDVIGTVHLRSLVGADGNAGDHVQAPLFLPESVSALDALRAMQAQRQQMVIVINEYGGTEGIVTVEDLVEELVGEIWSEDDRDVRTVQRHPDGALTVVGSFPVHDLSDLGIETPSGRYATVAELVLDQLRHIPRTGESTVINDWELRVEDATQRVVRRVRVSRRQSARSRPR